MLHKCIQKIKISNNKPNFFTFSNNCVILLNINSIFIFMTSHKIKIFETKTVEKEKLVAEKLNGRFAMMGFIALVGAYLTTGQIIPGFV